MIWRLLWGRGLRGGGIPLPFFEKKRKMFPEVLRCKMVALFLFNSSKLVITET